VNPTAFPEANVVLTKPESMTDEECGPLPVYRGGGECISCWELTGEEIMRILETKKIWVRVLSGNSQPPIALELENPFLPIEEKGEGMHLDLARAPHGRQPALGCWASSDSGARMCCPQCGTVLGLNGYDVDEEGNVSPAVVCEKDGCEWGRVVRLLDWR
jgi:hypothetical protein